ncbi:MAG: VOC family protein [Deltaproteobacteria bacterium]|nr:VOC family protein [Deltaproteobacteria bacterium]
MYPTNWFDLPTVDLSRAVTFYEAMLGTTLRRYPEGESGLPMAVFPYEMGYPSGCLVQNPKLSPPKDGTGAVLYFDTRSAPGGLDACVQRAAAAGAVVINARIDIGEHGVIAHLKDSEGNLIGLHAYPASA